MIGQLQINNLITKNGLICLSNSSYMPIWFNSNQLKSINTFIDINSNKDIYASLGLYNEPTRKIESNLKEVSSIFIDIDNHITTDSKIFKTIEEGLSQYYGYEIPKPSYTQLSGRGLHIVYFLENATDIIKWRKVAQALSGKIDELLPKADSMGVLFSSNIVTDKKVLEPTRYTRLDSSYNSKAKEYAKILRHNDIKYSLDEIIEEYPSLSTTKNDLKALRGLKTSEALNYTQKQIKAFKPYLKGYTTETINRSRIIDLKTLQRIRKENDNNVGYRAVMVGVMAQLLKAYYSDNIAIIEELEDFNAHFKEPLESNEVMAWYKSAMSNTVHFTNKTIIEKLDITLEEQEKLLTIISRKIKNKRYKSAHRETVNKAKRNHARKKRGTLKRRENLQARNIAIKKDKAQGLTYKDLEAKYKLKRTQLHYIINGL